MALRIHIKTHELKISISLAYVLEGERGEKAEREGGRKRERERKRLRSRRRRKKENRGEMDGRKWERGCPGSFG